MKCSHQGSSGILGRPAWSGTAIPVIALVMSSLAVGCQAGLGTDRGRGPDADSLTAAMALLFAPEATLAGNPNVYDVDIAFPDSDRLPVHRAGDLPQQGDTLRLDNLPAAATATLAMGLYLGNPDETHRTHSCHGEAPFSLKAGEQTSIAVQCMPVTTMDGSGPVKVFIKVARVSLTYKELDPGSVLATHDFGASQLYASLDAQERRISLRQDARGLLLHVAGDLTYFAPAGAPVGQSPADAPLARLISGEALIMTAISGRSVAAVAPEAELRLAGTPLLYETGPGTYGVVLGIELKDASGNVSVTGRLFEEPAGSEFTVAVYNVENFFDQIDDQRNAHYGDFRITPNDQGKVSNWGEKVLVDGRELTWTDIKAAGIRRALTGIDPSGPEVVALEEVESKVALDRLLEEMRDLGYVSSAFTEWPADTPWPAIGQGVISKFPVKAVALVQPALPASAPADAKDPLRPILKVTVEAHGHPLTVYVNHWKSKSGKESLRRASAQALQADLDTEMAVNPRFDYLIVGDLNSEYNEKVILLPEHNDTNGETGLNDVLKAQGNELAVARMTPPTWKYNFHYELNRGDRRSAWHQGYNWSSLDHMIAGPGVYDSTGVSYVDNSFQIAHAGMPTLKFLFREDGSTNRWHAERTDANRTTHTLGGYSDHAPLWARFRVPVRQEAATIWLASPGKADASDFPVAK